MTRWPGDARERLVGAAQQLAGEQGWDRVTVGAIARRAGVAESSFYRHFPDRRAVLVADPAADAALLREAVREAPPGATAMHAAGAAVEALCRRMELDPQAGARQTLVSAHGELRERDLARSAALADAVADALHDRGVDARVAALTASSAMLVLRTATSDWLAAGCATPLPRLFLRRLDDLARAFAE